MTKKRVRNNACDVRTVLGEDTCFQMLFFFRFSCSAHKLYIVYFEFQTKMYIQVTLIRNRKSGLLLPPFSPGKMNCNCPM